MTETIKEFVQSDEKIIEIEIERLRSFKNHPFQVKDDKEMYLLKESIEKYGILNPLIVRPVLDMVDAKKLNAKRFIRSSFGVRTSLSYWAIRTSAQLSGNPTAMPSFF